MDERGTSGDLSEIWIRCECGQERSMAQVAIQKAEVFGRCDGARPWLGPAMKEKCEEMNRLLVRTASNAYFPQRISVISLPERNETVREAVSAAWDFLETAESEEDITRERRKSKVRSALEGVSDAEVWAEIQARRGALTGQPKSVKGAELETLLAADDEIGEDRPEGVFYARTLPKSEWDRPWMSGIEKVVLVQRLREVMALVGFTRFEAAAPDTEGELDMGVRRAELARDLSWVPAVENKGEGVFLQFRKSAIDEWLRRDPVLQRILQLKRGFEAWKGGTQRIEAGVSASGVHLAAFVFASPDYGRGAGVRISGEFHSGTRLRAAANRVRRSALHGKLRCRGHSWWIDRGRAANRRLDPRRPGIGAALLKRSGLRPTCAGESPRAALPPRRGVSWLPTACGDEL